MGKTAFAINMSLRASVRSDVPVLYFNPSDGIQQAINRFIATQCRVGLQNIKTGYLDDLDWQKLYKGADGLAASSIYLYDSPRLTIEDVVKQTRKLFKKVDVG